MGYNRCNDEMRENEDAEVEPTCIYLVNGGMENKKDVKGIEQTVNH